MEMADVILIFMPGESVRFDDEMLATATRINYCTNRLFVEALSAAHDLMGCVL